MTKPCHERREAEGDAADHTAEGRPWPQSAYNSDSPEWVEYLHQGYYLLGMLWAVGASDEAIAALCEVAKAVAEKSVPASAPTSPS